MVMVNNPGSWSHVYSPLRHAEWHGCTPTDLIFPFFLFIVGAAAAFSLGATRSVVQTGKRRRTLARVFRRCAVLFLLGLVLNGFPEYNLDTIRIPGVLQRIALVYMLLAPLVLFVAPRWQAALVFAGAFGHWGLLVGFGGDSPFDAFANASRALDLLVLDPFHLYREGAGTDPEGLLGTIPALLTAWLGYASGVWIRSKPSTGAAAAWLVVAGVIAVGLGWLWSLWLPMNKPLWTGSYALFTGGWAAIGLGLLLQLIDVMNTRRAFEPAITFGLNAIFVFVASGLLARLLIRIPAFWAGADAPTLKAWAFSGLEGLGLKPLDASLAYALLNVLLWWPILALMRMRGWLIKV